MTEPTVAHSAVTTGGLVVRAALRTDVGLVRSENQDFGTYTTPAEENASMPRGRLMIVADGMGGHRGGATASRLAAEIVKAQYLGAETEDIPTALREALTGANARIFAEAQSNPDLQGMGTTTSALAIRENLGWFAHVGDSRIYLVRDEEISQMTEDHSLVASMVREGLLTSKEAESHPRRNVLQRSMGVSEDVEIDIKGPFEVHEGDTFIICSDGLHGVVKEEELKEMAKLRIEVAADEFVQLALERGGPDNVTVIVARAERAGNGDETEVDIDRHRDSGAFDETIRDEGPAPDRIPTMPGPVPAAEGESLPPTWTSGDHPPLEQALPQEPPPAIIVGAAPAPSFGNALVKWMLIVVLVLGAAGAWLFWNRQQAVEAPRPVSSSSR